MPDEPAENGNDPEPVAEADKPNDPESGDAAPTIGGLQAEIAGLRALLAHISGGTIDIDAELDNSATKRDGTVINLSRWRPAVKVGDEGGSKTRAPVKVAPGEPAGRLRPAAEGRGGPSAPPSVKGMDDEQLMAALASGGYEAIPQREERVAMAFASGEWLEAWSRATIFELRQRSIWANLMTNTGTAPWVSGAAEVNIPKPVWTNAAAADRARGGDWDAATQVAQDLVIFKRTGGSQVVNSVLWEDSLEVPWPLINDLRSRQAYEMAKRHDAQLYAYLIGANGISTANAKTYGSATKYVSRTAPYEVTGTGAEQMIFEALDDYQLKLQRADALDGVGDRVGQAYAVMPPELFRVLRKDMVKRELDWDLMTAELFRSGGILAGGKAFQGRLLGIDIFSWNGIAVPSSGDWKLVCGARAGMAAATRPALVQFFSPAENQVSSAAGYLSRQTHEFGQAMLDSSVFTEVTIEGGA